MADDEDEAVRRANEFAAKYRELANSFGLTDEQITIADNIAVELGIEARRLRFKVMDKDGINCPSIMDAVSLALALMHIDHRERDHKERPCPPPPRDIDDLK